MDHACLAAEVMGDAIVLVHEADGCAIGGGGDGGAACGSGDGFDYAMVDRHALSDNRV
jgi:hypothetical protein